MDKRKWDDAEAMGEEEKPAYGEHSFDILESSRAYITISYEEEGYVQLDATYDVILDGLERTEIGQAILYAFVGKDSLQVLDAADSISGDVLYAVECASSFDSGETRLFIVMDHFSLADNFNDIVFRTDMIHEISGVLAFMCSSFYFTFLPETLFLNDKTEYQITIQQFVDEGYQINVGPDHEQACLGKVIKYPLEY